MEFAVVCHFGCFSQIQVDVQGLNRYAVIFESVSIVVFIASGKLFESVLESLFICNRARTFEMHFQFVFAQQFVFCRIIVAVLLVIYSFTADPGHVISCGSIAGVNPVRQVRQIGKCDRIIFAAVHVEYDFQRINHQGVIDIDEFVVGRFSFNKAFCGYQGVSIRIGIPIKRYVDRCAVLQIEATGEARLRIDIKF